MVQATIWSESLTYCLCELADFNIVLMTRIVSLRLRTELKYGGTLDVWHRIILHSTETVLKVIKLSVRQMRRTHVLTKHTTLGLALHREAKWSLQSTSMEDVYRLAALFSSKLPSLWCLHRPLQRKSGINKYGCYWASTTWETESKGCIKHLWEHKAWTQRSCMLRSCDLTRYMCQQFFV